MPVFKKRVDLVVRHEGSPAEMPGTTLRGYSELVVSGEIRAVEKITVAVEESYPVPS